MPNLNDAKAAITRPIGPLPAWGWVAVVVGGYFAYKFISGRSGGTTNSTPAVGSTLPTDGSNGALDSLTQSIQDLLSKLSNSGSNGGGGSGGGILVTNPIDTGSGSGGSSGGGGEGSGGGGGSNGGGNGTTTSGTNPVAAVVDSIKTTGSALATMTPNLPAITDLGSTGPLQQAVMEKNFMALKSTLDTSKNTVTDQLQKPLTTSSMAAPLISVASPGTSNNLAQPSLIQDIGGTTPTSLTGDVKSVGSVLSAPTMTETAKVAASSPIIPAQTPTIRNTGTALRNRVR